MSRRSRWIVAMVACVAAITAAAAPAVDDPDLSSARTIDPYKVRVVQTTADLSQALTPQAPLEFSRSKPPGGPIVSVNTATQFQVVHGFGAAMTDSSAWLIERELPGAARRALMARLFGPSGIGLSFLRVPIAASDFTKDGTPYSYDDMPGDRTDESLSHFSIAHDRAYVLPALREARALNPSTEFLATPWSPPAWMKLNDSLDNAGNRGRLLDQDDRAWAHYLVKFISAYAHAGIPITALTLQNEPGVPTLYPGLNVTAFAQASWLVHDLEPALAKARLHPRIYGADRGWGTTTNFAAATLHTAALSDLTGLAWHCYFGAPTVMQRFHQLALRLEQIVDECSPGISSSPISEVVISSLRNWASTVALWNLALDPTGGPAQPPNHGCPGCSGLATINPQSHTDTLNLNYYEVGQASAFISSGARRISSPTFVGYRYPGPGVNVATPGLDDVALRNPDGSIVLIAYDNTDAPITFSVAWHGRTFGYTLPANATVTFVWNRP
jgi:glucosylceramidase